MGGADSSNTTSDATKVTPTSTTTTTYLSRGDWENNELGCNNSVLPNSSHCGDGMPGQESGKLFANDSLRMSSFTSTNTSSGDTRDAKAPTRRISTLGRGGGEESTPAQSFPVHSSLDPRFDENTGANHTGTSGTVDRFDSNVSANTVDKVGLTGMPAGLVTGAGQQHTAVGFMHEEGQDQGKRTKVRKTEAARDVAEAASGQPSADSLVAEDEVKGNERGKGKKRGRRSRGSAGAPKDDTCTIEGCTNLCDSLYTRRYHTCRKHIEALDVLKDGQHMRFCQRCSSFHNVDAFEGRRHTCRAALIVYNAARRKVRQAAKELQAAQLKKEAEKAEAKKREQQQAQERQWQQQHEEQRRQQQLELLQRDSFTLPSHLELRQDSFNSGHSLPNLHSLRQDSFNALLPKLFARDSFNLTNPQGLRQDSFTSFNSLGSFQSHQSADSNEQWRNAMTAALAMSMGGNTDQVSNGATSPPAMNADAVPGTLSGMVRDGTGPGALNPSGFGAGSAAMPANASYENFMAMWNMGNTLQRKGLEGMQRLKDGTLTFPPQPAGAGPAVTPNASLNNPLQSSSMMLQQRIAKLQQSAAAVVSHNLQARQDNSNTSAAVLPSATLPGNGAMNMLNQQDHTMQSPRTHQGGPWGMRME